MVQLLVWVPSPVPRAICKQFLSKKREAVRGWVGWPNKLGKRPAWRLKIVLSNISCLVWFYVALLGGLSFEEETNQHRRKHLIFWNKPPPEKLWWNGCFPISLPNIFGVKALVLRETMEKQETTNSINWITHKETNLEPKNEPIEKEKCIFQTSILGVLIRALPKHHCWSQLVEFLLSFMRRWICTERCERSHHCASATHFNGERAEGHELVD